VFHGSGFTGSGEKKLQGTIGFEALADGTFRILTASTEIGQGTKTIFCQLAADALGVGLEMVTLAPQDTSLVPDSGPTVASRTAMIVGRLVQEAATEIKERLKREKAPLRLEKSYIQPDEIHWDETTYRGDAYPVYAWACTIADVDVDHDDGRSPRASASSARLRASRRWRSLTWAALACICAVCRSITARRRDRGPPTRGVRSPI